MIRRLLRPLRPRIARFFQRRLIARGVDQTASIATGRALILAPHPDDEAIGCGVLIARKAAAGTEVTVVIATDGRRGKRALTVGADELARVRRGEAIEAGRALGLEPNAIRFLEFEDGSLDGQRDRLLEALRELIADLEPDEIYAPQVDEHNDHRTLSEVARLAAGTTAARLYEYPVRYWGRVPWVVAAPGRIGAAAELVLAPLREWRRAPAVLIRTEGFHERKLAALGVYAGEMQAIGEFVLPYANAGYEVFFPVAADQ